jgi:hypothetical protein
MVKFSCFLILGRRFGQGLDQNGDCEKCGKSLLKKK